MNNIQLSAMSKTWIFRYQQCQRYLYSNISNVNDINIQLSTMSTTWISNYHQHHIYWKHTKIMYDRSANNVTHLIMAWHTCQQSYYLESRWHIICNVTHLLSTWKLAIKLIYLVTKWHTWNQSDTPGKNATHMISKWCS